MASLAIEVQDMATVQSLLVMPSQHRRPATPHEMAAFVSRLAPIEMSAPSISSSAVQGKANTGKDEQQGRPSPSPKPLSVPGWAVPVGYTTCGCLLCLCNILVPHGLVACGHVLCPAWTLTLAAHAVAEGENVWLWFGTLVGLLWPFVVLLRDTLFVGFYLLVVAAYGSGRFWLALRGPAFVAVCGCWFGLGAACVLAALSDHPRAQLSVAAFLSLACAVVSSACRFRGLVLRVGY